MHNSDKITLMIHFKGQLVHQITLENNTDAVLGSSPECNITLESDQIAPKHLKIINSNNQLALVSLEGEKGTFINNQQLQPQQQYAFEIGTNVLIANDSVSLSIEKSGKSTKATSENIEALLAKQGEVIIGRHSSCDYTLSSLQISRRHARLTKVGSEYFIEDLGAENQKPTNGTYVNGEKIKAKVAVVVTDVISIGPDSFTIGSGEIEYSIVAENVEKIYSNGYVGLNKTNFKIPNRQFVALMGPSGCGKSTLLTGLNGANPVSGGSITIQGLSLNNKNFNLLKKNIGYVPQEDIVHGELSVEKTLFYAAKLRMSSDVSNKEIDKKINQVLASLNLANAGIKQNKVSELSGGQRKRISIAVELLNDPKILFLDEPTSPLDPETIEDFLSCIRGLVKEGQTVIMVTHKPADLNYVDKVIFLSKGGYQTYYGDKDGMLEYFGKNNLIEIYALMKSPDVGKQWYEKWLAKNPVDKSEIAYEELVPSSKTSYLRQFFWQSARYANIKYNDFWNLILTVAQPVIVAALVIFIFSHLQVSVLFMMSLSAIWFGVSNASKEIVNELPIYERERMYDLAIPNYIASKVLVLSLLALIQILIYTCIIYYNYTSDEISLWEFVPNAAFMFYISVSATIFGLFLSSIFSSVEKVMTFVPIALIPQILLAGSIAPLDTNLKIIASYLTFGRWGTEGFAHIQDMSAEDLGYWADLEETIPAGVMQQGIVPDLDGENVGFALELSPTSALDYLAYYKDNEDLISLVPETLQGNLLALAVMNVFFLCGLYLALKQKDKKFVW